jgi:selenocysteine lyase/cysteine desulfurase
VERPGPTRRQLFAELSVPAVAAAALLRPRRARAALAAVAAAGGAADELARDEDFWFEVQQAFAVDRSLVNLNNGGVSPSPAVVQAAMRRHLEYSNTAPAYTMWTVLEPQREPVRQRLAALLGCAAEEVALTRNASEGLETCQLGLDLGPGDEVLASDQDYPRMLTTWRQRERRDGIVLRTFPLPPPAAAPEEVVAAYAAGLSDRTRAVLVSHVVNLTGRILPVREIVALARARGVPAIVDGAHSFAHFPFTRDELDCDYFATSLHKWLFAPHGTGLLYVRRERIAGLWPLMAAPAEMDGDVRKFEEIGTHPAANHLAIAEALTFHEGIGAARKAARLRHLRDRWARPLVGRPGVRLHTNLDPGRSCALATVEVVGVPADALARHLWERHRILVTAIRHPDVEGIRVTPSVYTTLGEIDRFREALDTVVRHGRL